MLNLDLSGKRALVCGGSKGIGKACATELADLGAEVTVLARDAAALEAVRGSLSARFGQGHAIAIADAADANSVESAIRGVLARGPVHILLNNTGGPPGGAILDAAPAAFAEAFRNHLLFGQTMVQAFTPGMKDAGYGRIINIVSTSVRQPIPGLGVSNTIRGAVASWAKTLSMELARFNITVNNILPGFTDTERLASLTAARARTANKTEAQIADEMRSTIPMGRFGEPSEIAAAAAFLASPAASYITGVSLIVDGGRTGTI